MIIAGPGGLSSAKPYPWAILICRRTLPFVFPNVCLILEFYSQPLRGEGFDRIYLIVYILRMIKEAKIFMNGQSQAVRLPKEFRFDTKSVYINRIGDVVMLIPSDNPWKGMIEACHEFTDDFMAEREQPVVQERNWPE